MGATAGFGTALLPSLSSAMSVVSTLSRVAQTFDSLSGGSERSKNKTLERQQQLAYQQLVARNQLQQQTAETDAAQQKAALEAGAAAEEIKRIAALKRAVSRQRAVFGGQGVSPDEGSAEAVLLGLFEESETEKKQREQGDVLRMQAIESGLAGVRRRNLLEETQLAAQQQLR